MASDERDKDGSPILGWVAVAAYVVFRLWVEKLNVPIAMWWVIFLVIAIGAWPTIQKRSIVAASGYVTIAFLFSLGFLVLWLFRA